MLSVDETLHRSSGGVLWVSRSDASRAAERREVPRTPLIRRSNGAWSGWWTSRG